MEYVDTNDIARDLGLSTRTVQKYIKERFLPPGTMCRGTGKGYKIKTTEYIEWKQRYFAGLNKKEINKHNRLDKPLNKTELKALIKPWLRSLATGTLNGRIYSSMTIESYEYFTTYYFRSLSSGAYSPWISSKNLKLIFGKIEAKKYAAKQKIFDALMCFTRYLIDEGKMEEAERDAMKKLRPKRFFPAEKITLSEQQIDLILKTNQEATGKNTYDKLLTKTLVIFLKETGLRASELCNLKLQDIDLDNRVVHVWLGKGNKNRKVGITKPCYEALKDYIVVRSRKQSKLECFFLTKHDKQLTRNTLRLRWNRLSKTLGFKITSHGFRRSFVTINVNKGKPLVHLQIAAGHSDIKTTRGYCTTNMDTVSLAMQSW